MKIALMLLVAIGAACAFTACEKKETLGDKVDAATSATNDAAAKAKTDADAAAAKAKADVDAATKK